MGNITTKDEKQTEFISAFTDSPFNNQTRYLQSTQPPELKDRDGGEKPYNSGGNSYQHDTPPGLLQIYWARLDLAKGTEGAGGSAC